MTRLLVMGITLAAMATQVAAGEPSADSGLDVRPVTVGQQITFHSQILDEERALLVATPAAYEVSEDPVPVLVVLDGRTQFLHTVASADLLAKVGSIPPLLVVGITNVDRARDFTAVTRESGRSGGAERFVSFIGDEVLPLVERSFRTAPYRILVGHSLGGLLAVHGMIQRPELFTAVIAISPAITADERDLPVGVTPVTERLAEALASAPERRRDLYITVSGEEDERWLEDFDRLQRTLSESAPAALDWEVVRLADENHGTVVVESTFEGLKSLFLGWDGRELRDSESLEAVLSHYRALSQRLGWEVTPPEALVNTVGYRLLLGGRVDEAVTVFETNVRLRPESANVYDSLGEALERRGSLPGALRNYRTACRLGEASGHAALAVFERNRNRLEARLAERGDD